MGTSYTINGDQAIISINPSVYSLERVYATAYVHIDRIWFLFDGDPSTEIIVKATRKDPSTDLDQFAKRFLNEIISISNYFNQFELNRDIITAILQRALFSASPETAKEAEQQEVQRILEEVNTASSLHPPTPLDPPTPLNPPTPLRPATHAPYQ